MSLLLKPMIEPFRRQKFIRCASTWAARCRDREGAWPSRGSSPRLLTVSPAEWPLRSMPARPQPGRLPAPPELQQIVCGSEHLPLAVTGHLPSSHKPVTATGALDLSEHRLDRLAAFLVQTTSARRQQCALHAVAGRQPLRTAAAWWLLLSQRLALFPIFGCGNQQCGPGWIRLRQVGLAARAGIGQGGREDPGLCELQKLGVIHLL